MPFLSGVQSVQVFSCFASAYLLSYAFRAINAVIAPALMADIGLSNADLGLLSSAYFIAFASLQLPLGIWLDKYGARRTEAALLLFAAAGAIIFATSTSLGGLWMGRAMIGVGVSACLMAPFKAYRQWYAPQRQSQLASWMLVAGTSGALLTTVPVAAAMPLIGWRGVFWLMAALILLAALAIFVLVKDVEDSYPKASLTPLDDAAGYREIFSDPYFRRLGILGLVNQGIFIAIQTLWAGPWMRIVLGMSQDQTAQILLLFNLALLIAYIGLGWWAPRFVAQGGARGWPVVRVVALGLLGTLATQVAILFCTAPWAWLLWLLLAVFVTVGTLVQTTLSLSFPASQAGRANSAYNLLLFIGAFSSQWGIGVLIDVFQAHGAGPVAAMQGAFAFGVLLQTAALIVFVSNRAQARMATD